MESWQEDLLGAADQASTPAAVFASVEAGAKALGFEHCAYGLRVPVPVTKPRTVLMNNYPRAWQMRYAEADYIRTDPTVAHCRRSRAALVWRAEVFEDAKPMWDEARSCGLHHGWAKSSLDANGVGGMLTLARSGEPLSDEELESKTPRMNWLAHIAHLSLARLMIANLAGETPALTEREVEVMKWTADGKTSSETAEILAVSENTVNFHVKNAIAKLGTANKTAAAVRAAVLGLLN